jgi:tetratricopeptide (TPR) repeat protein
MMLIPRRGRVRAISFIHSSDSIHQQRKSAMRLRSWARWGLLAATAIGFLAISACGTKEPEPNSPPSAAPVPQAGQPIVPTPPGELKNEISSSELSTVMAAHYNGLGHMERYEYRDAVLAFREVRKRAPGWIPGSINLAIALLNDSGQKAEEAKKAGEDLSVSNFEESLALLAGVLARDPDNPHAHFCRGIILQQIGLKEIVEAHGHFKRVTEIDPNDAAAWYWMASTVYDPDDVTRADARKLAVPQIPLFKKALELDPNLASALYKLAFAYAYSGQAEKQKELLATWSRIKPDQNGPVPGTGDVAEAKYGDMGKYGNVVNPFPRLDSANEARAPAPVFEAAVPLDVKLPEGDRWVKETDFTGSSAVAGRVRARFGAAVSAFDADGDGTLDLYLASAVFGPKGVRDVLLLNKGDGRFEDGSAAFGLPADRASLGVAAGDFDADRHIDLFLTGVGGNRLLRKREGKKLEDISSVLKPMGAPAVSLLARWLDLDQDGDLDLYVVNYCAAADADKAFTGAGEPPPGLANAVYRNDGEPNPGSAPTIQGRAPVATAYGRRAVEEGLSIVLSPWPGSEPLLGGARAHTGIALLDIDNDRDLDLVLTAEKNSPIALLNDRLGLFHEATIEGIAAVEGGSGLLTTNLDVDGRSDLVAACSTGPVLAWRNTTQPATTDKIRLTFESWPINASRWRAAQAVDLDLDGRTDLLGLPSGSSEPGEIVLPAWARNDGKRFALERLSIRAENPALVGLAAVDLAGDPLPEILMLRPGDRPAIARNSGNGQHWLAVRLGGYWRVKPELMRTNSHAIGTRVTLEGQGLFVPYDHTTPESGLGQSIAPFVLGLGSRGRADLVHLRWPDGVMQCEMSQAADLLVDLAENNRKTGSCPVLFTWNGRRYVCIGDFLGGGGMGYLVAPGVYGQPDRDEAMAITSEQLQPKDGVYRLSITEPMDEIAYLDHLMLDVVDRPRGVSSHPDERFAPQGPRPTGELLAWRTAVEPEHATDLHGGDVTEIVRRWDRRTVDGFRKLSGWIGYAEEHGIILDFGDRLSRYGPGEGLVLCLVGWVEYPYSQTNYAAATAGVALRPPAIERLGDGGMWRTIEPHAGYPAGLPRLMTLDLTGKLTGARCVLRIKTNMECYYDQAFIAVRDRSAERALRVKSLPVARAVLGYRGYTREVSPDGEQPLIYDYDYVDPAPLARLSGKLTRFGDVAGLLRTDDDQLCLIGPGDELRVEFEASGLPELAPGWTRSYVLRSFGYCKDADPFTAGGDTVEPLPWRGMPPYPFDRGVSRPPDAAYQSYLRTSQTRSAGGERP